MEAKCVVEGRFSCLQIREFTREVFKRYGLEANDAAQAADVLCTADEWGIRSHGVARLRSYCEMLAEGRINAKAKPHIVKDRPSMVLVDGDNGLGLVVGAFANRIAMERAKRSGIGWVNVINSNHFGIAGYFSIQGLSDDLIGLSMTNTPPLVAPFGGAERRLGTNPISMAFPANDEPPIVIDLATSAISLGAVENAEREGGKIPPLSVVDSFGEASLEPHALFQGGSLLPLGGTRETGGHKGYCLATMVDLLCGVFPGASWGPFVPPFRNHAPMIENDAGPGIGHLFGSIWAGAFEDASLVRKRVDSWVRTMRNTKPDSSSKEVLIPGDPERTAAADSVQNGVALDRSVVEDLRRLASELRIPFEESK